MSYSCYSFSEGSSSLWDASTDKMIYCSTLFPLRGERSNCLHEKMLPLLAQYGDNAPRDGIFKIIHHVFREDNICFYLENVGDVFKRKAILNNIGYCVDNGFCSGSFVSNKTERDFKNTRTTKTKAPKKRKMEQIEPEPMTNNIHLKDFGCQTTMITEDIGVQTIKEPIYEIDVKVVKNVVLTPAASIHKKLNEYTLKLNRGWTLHSKDGNN